MSRTSLPRLEISTVGLLAAAILALHLATTSGYGYFRDELYYLACGRHLGLGYVDHPPLVGLVAAAVRSTLGTSLFALRLLPALAFAGVVACTGAMARELGGRRMAQGLAALSAAVAPVYLALGSVFSMNAFDVLFWAVCFLILIRLLRGADERLWFVFGLVAGLGLLNKISMLFLGFGVAVGLVAGRRGDLLRSRWPWLGGLLAAALFLPHVVWQAQHGWPTLEFMQRAQAVKNVSLGPGAFLLEQAVQMGPASLPVWLAGLLWLLLGRESRDVRPLGWAYLAVLGIMLGTASKPYYLAPAYPVLFAAGGAALERFSERWAARAVLRTALVGLVGLAGLVIAPLAKPLLPVETYVRYAAALGVEAAPVERHEMGRLPQFFADMHGWRELAEAVAEVARTLPPDERGRACVFGQNYGQAGAIDLFGPVLGLGPAISAHNSYFLWGPGRCTGDVLIVLADNRERLEELFEQVELGAVFDCRDCMPYEDDKPIWIARRLRVPLGELWPQIKHYD